MCELCKLANNLSCYDNLLLSEEQALGPKIRFETCDKGFCANVFEKHWKSWIHKKNLKNVNVAGRLWDICNVKIRSIVWNKHSKSH